MTYFFDNNIAPAIPEALRALREDAVHICDCAAHGITRGDADVDWMPKVAKLAWFAVTVDNNIQRRREERKVREECGLRVIYLPGTFGRKLHFLPASGLRVPRVGERRRGDEGRARGRSLRLSSPRILLTEEWVAEILRKHASG